MSVVCRCTNLPKGKAFCNKVGELCMAVRKKYSTGDRLPVLNIPENEIRKSILISQSTDIFTNLALEDWFYRHEDFSYKHVMLVWKNDPCVVIGRHQNPWLECNMPFCEKHAIDIARRNSGGGTVYHDQGNLNLTFFTPRARYDRKYNLNIITRALFRSLGINSIVNDKDDIVVHGGYKISGTAAKLGQPNAYHHCTLLVDANTNALSTALKKTETGITTNATESTRSPVKNLSEIRTNVKINGLINEIGCEYLRTKANTLEDGGQKQVQQQNGFQMVNPNDGWFPGVEKIAEELRSWAWVYGKTPSFTVTRLLEAPRSGDQSKLVKLIIEVERGIVQDIKMTLPSDFNRDASVISNLRGKRYSHELTDSIIEATGCKVVARDQSADQSDIAAI